MPSAEGFSVPADAVEFCLCECICVKELNKIKYAISGTLFVDDGNSEKIQ